MDISSSFNAVADLGGRGGAAAPPERWIIRIAVDLFLLSPFPPKRHYFLLAFGWEFVRLTICCF